MKTLNEVVQRMIAVRQERGIEMTLLAVCPNSEAVLEAAVKAAAMDNFPMLFAATLTQIDRYEGYTRWTPSEFVLKIKRLAEKHCWGGPLYPCLDHGGPWLKDNHTLKKLSYTETMSEVKASLTACLEAGYHLIHVDTTVDRTLAPGEVIDIGVVVARTLELIEYTEKERGRLSLPPVSYEVGTEEVHGGLVDRGNFTEFLTGLRRGLEEKRLLHVWPCFIVGRVGTDLHTTSFEYRAAERLFSIVSPMDSLVKGHYTDWCTNLTDYPRSGMGGANVGPEFTSEEYLALQELCAKEALLCRNRGRVTSGFMAVLEQAIDESGRWRKWLHPEEEGCDLRDLAEDRRAWLLQTGARYVWTDPGVEGARKRLYANLEPVIRDPHQFVVDRVLRSIEKYVTAFNLFDALSILEED